MDPLDIVLDIALDRAAIETGAFISNVNKYIQDVPILNIC